MGRLRDRIAVSLVLGAVNALFTGLAYLSAGTRFSNLGALWLFAFVLPTLLVTMLMAVKDALKRSMRLQAFIALLISAPSALWIYSVRF
jgi:formate hydrogenlyase subunit 4